MLSQREVVRIVDRAEPEPDSDLQRSLGHPGFDLEQSQESRQLPQVVLRHDLADRPRQDTLPQSVGHF